MKKFIVVGNPIDHSLSPKLHNYWIKNNNLKSVYGKEKVSKSDLKHVVERMRKNELTGINITVPFKKEIIPFADELTDEAKATESVNTLFKKNDKLIGHNTDISGFELSLRYANINMKGKKVLILGAGGVCPSLIYVLNKLETSELSISNRTFDKAKALKDKFQNINLIEWNKFYDFDVVINATTLGLKETDRIKIQHEKLGPNKIFYDIIYNPKETNFLKEARLNNHIAENGSMMFIYQAHQAFTIWHNIMPKIDDELIEFLNEE